jgi:hypothetical protein
MHGLVDGFNPTMGLGVRYGFTQSIPGLNPWWDFIPCNRTRPYMNLRPRRVPGTSSQALDPGTLNILYLHYAFCFFPETKLLYLHDAFFIP